MSAYYNQPDNGQQYEQLSYKQQNNPFNGKQQFSWDQPNIQFNFDQQILENQQNQQQYQNKSNSQVNGVLHHISNSQYNQNLVNNNISAQDHDNIHENYQNVKVQHGDDQNNINDEQFFTNFQKQNLNSDQMQNQNNYYQSNLNNDLKLNFLGQTTKQSQQIEQNLLNQKQKQTTFTQNQNNSFNFSYQNNNIINNNNQLPQEISSNYYNGNYKQEYQQQYQNGNLDYQQKSQIQSYQDEQEEDQDIFELYCQHQEALKKGDTNMIQQGQQPQFDNNGQQIQKLQQQYQLLNFNDINEQEFDLMNQQNNDCNSNNNIYNNENINNNQIDQSNAKFNDRSIKKSQFGNFNFNSTNVVEQDDFISQMPQQSYQLQQNHQQEMDANQSQKSSQKQQQQQIQNYYNNNTNHNNKLVDLNLQIKSEDLNLDSQQFSFPDQYEQQQSQSNDDTQFSSVQNQNSQKQVQNEFNLQLQQCEQRLNNQQINSYSNLNTIGSQSNLTLNNQNNTNNNYMNNSNSSYQQQQQQNSTLKLDIHQQQQHSGNSNNRQKKLKKNLMLNVKDNSNSSDSSQDNYSPGSNHSKLNKQKISKKSKKPLSSCKKSARLFRVKEESALEDNEYGYRSCKPYTENQFQFSFPKQKIEDQQPINGQIDFINNNQIKLNNINFDDKNIFENININHKLYLNPNKRHLLQNHHGPYSCQKFEYTSNQTSYSQTQSPISPQKLDRKANKPSRINTSHVPLNMFNSLYMHLIKLYSQVPCKCGKKLQTGVLTPSPVKQASSTGKQQAFDFQITPEQINSNSSNNQEQQQKNNDLCKKCFDIEILQQIKKSPRKNIETFRTLWQKSVRLQKLSENFLLYFAHARFLSNTQYRSSQSANALYSCLPTFLNGSRNYKHFYKLQA